MYNLNLQARAFHTLSQLFTISSSVRNSTLLQLFSMAMEMRHMSSVSPDQAYLNLLAIHKAHPNGLHHAPLREHISSNTFLAVTSELAQLSYVDFLTYAVPSLVCDPQKAFTILQKSYPEISYVEMTHHIIHVKLAYYQMDKLTKSIAQQGYDDILDVLYKAYTSIESTSVLCKKDFLSLYSSINTFELSPKELAPKSRGSGFNDSDIDTIMELLTDQLQLTRPQQLDLVTQCFCSSAQAADIVCNAEIYNFTSIKDTQRRRRIAKNAHRLIAKVPPLELICAISLRKKRSSVSSSRHTEAMYVPNDVMLENGFVFPTLKKLIGYGTNNSVLLVYPSAHFIRKILSDPPLCNQNISIALQSKNMVSLLNYQLNDSAYATQFTKGQLYTTQQLEKQIENNTLSYDKIIVFGNHLSVDQQQSLISNVLGAAADGCNVYALLSTYVIETNSHSAELDYVAPFLKSISLLPQGINNSSFPRRKLWAHFSKAEVRKTEDIKLYAYTLDTSAKTQAVSPLRDKPVSVPNEKISTLGQSIRKCFAEEIMARKAPGRTRALAFTHEITPDIPVWCSRTFPRGQDKNPRLEAYVCKPPHTKKANREFSGRGEIIQSTKKHTTQVSQADIFDWLERSYPFSTVQQRKTAVEKETSNKEVSNDSIHIRDEIIQAYTPLLEKQNIALKTLWYLYPNLSNKYTTSDYLILSQMMQTTIGQQRVCDITSDLAEILLIAEYPDLNETALWHYYTILSIAMEKAVQYGYCAKNPLEDALRQEKLRRKLFAQVRKQLVKKHLSKPELIAAYAKIVQHLEGGNLEYLGVLIRLLTGLESTIVCALCWKDIIIGTNMDVAWLVITKQLSTDGKETFGLSDIEDYILFPLPTGLHSIIEYYHALLPSISEENRILDSLLSISYNKAEKVLTPSRLNILTKEILKVYNVEDNIFNLATGDNEFKKINLNKYTGDFIRENFRYWATMEAKLLPAELSYLLRNRIDSTCGRYYCDFQSEVSMAVIATKLSRLESLLLQKEAPITQRESVERIHKYEQEIPSSRGYRQSLSIEITGESPIEFPKGIFIDSSTVFSKEEA